MSTVIGKYCIYEARTDEWLDKYNQWMSHRDKVEYDIPKSFDISVYNSSGVNSLNLDFDLIPSGNVEKIVTFDNDYIPFNVHDLMTFDSFKEAEDYIMSQSVPMKIDTMLSIRKIYFT